MKHIVMSWPAPTQRPQLEHRPGTPLYEMILVQLTEALFADPPPNDKLPPEPELCERFSVSRTTLRRALDELETRGLIVRRQGLGTFFLGGNPLPAIPDLISTIDVMRAVPGFSSRCLVFDTVPAAQRVADALAVEEDVSVLHVKRLDRVGQIPVAIVDVFVPEPLLSEITRADIEGGSMYSLLERKGFPASYAKQFVYADEWADDDAVLMDVAPGAAALTLERTTYTRPEVPVEFAVMRFKQRTFRIEMTLSRVPGATSINLTARDLGVVAASAAESTTTG
jgi:GntR family transcriptional regulator